MLAHAQVRVISFGRDNRIQYDLHTGRYDVIFDGKEMIRDAYALCKAGDSLAEGGLDSRTSYTSRTWSSATFSDSSGSGIRYTVTLTGGGRPAMEQVFYVYRGEDYFYVEVRLAGGGTGCDYMSPLHAGNAELYEYGDNRALRVPFDNDAWVRYNAAPLASAGFTSAEVTAIYNNTDRHGLVVGSVDHHDWKSGITIEGADSGRLSRLTVFAGYTDSIYTRDAKGHGRVVADKEHFIRSPRMMVGWFSDWRKGLEQYADANRKAVSGYIGAWTKGTPFGWNSWGTMQSGLTLPKAKGVVDFFHDSCPGFRNADNTLYIDLDSYWDNLAEGGMTGDFSRLTEFCRYCRRKGFRPGIYWAPFADWGKTSRKIESADYNYADCWIRSNGHYMDLDGARAMDPTHPGTKARIAYLIGRFRACGFQMIKIDFLGHAALEADSYYDPSVHTGMQAFRKGMEWLVDQLDGKMLVYAAISPSMATARYVHMRRIACDAFSNIGETDYTLNSTTYGWWQGRLYEHIDADHLVFKAGPAGVNRARLVSGIVTGTLIMGDDYSVEGPWRTMAQGLLQNRELLAVARNGRAFRPVEGNTGERAGNCFYGEAGGHVYLAIVNYGDTALTYTIDPLRWGMKVSGDHWTMKELFSGKMVEAAGTIGGGDGPGITVTVPPADAVIFSGTGQE